MSRLPRPRHLGRLAKTLMAVWGVAGLLVALTVWLALAQSDQIRRRDLEGAERDLANLTRVVQEHAERTLHSADQVLRFVQARYLELGDRLDLARLTEQGIIDAEHFPQIGIINAKGLYVLANRPVTVAIDLSDREHFRFHLDHDNDELFISKPVLGRASGRWSIQLTRRINLPNGQFGGVAVLSLDPGYFSRFYSELALGRQGTAALVGLDGIVRARESGGREQFGLDLSGSELLTRVQRGDDAGGFRVKSKLDGVERLLNYRTLKRYPLLVFTGFSVEDILASAQEARSALLRQAAMVSLLLMVLAGVISRQLLLVQDELAARAEAQRRVSEANGQLSDILALSADGFVGFDPAGRLRYLSPGFAQLTGADAGTFKGMSEAVFAEWLDSLCSPLDQFPGAHAVDRNGVPLRDCRYLLLTHSQRVLQMSARQSHSDFVRKILHFHDVTHETAVDQIKSEFIATAAHELRTPLASVYGFSELLLTERHGEADRKEFLQIIFEQARVMSKILDELLDLSRMEARRGKDFRRESLDLRTLVAEVVRSAMWPEGRTPPDIAARDVPLMVQADPGKLKQALLNVLSNAYKFSPEGGPVTVRLFEQEVDGRWGASIVVVDMGTGMEPAIAARICERFFRADGSGKVPGTGLGMSIVKEIMTMHEGTVEVKSAVGMGTAVTLWLPKDSSGEGPVARVRTP
jgi:signal transduction histidine kinase